MFFSPQFFVFLVIILIAEICAGVLLYFQKGTLETLIGRPRIISSFQRFLNQKPLYCHKAAKQPGYF
jgi:hypothetical protein